MKHRVLLIEPTIQPVGVDLIKENCETFMAPDGKEETLIRCINENQIEGMVTRVETITRKIFKSCPTLKIVAQHGVGEHVMMFVLANSRTLLQADYAVRHGNWKFRETNIPHAVAEKTLLIVGLGRIGRTVAKMAAAFDMNVMAYDPFIPANKMAELGIKKAETLDDGLKAADYVTIQLHLTPETRGMMSTEQFKIMKKSAVLLNLSRGPVVDQAALYEALKNHEIAGAALDVLASEPPAADEPLLTLDNVIFTPHFGGDTYEAKQTVSRKTAENLIKALDGEDTYNWVNRK